MIEWIPLLTAVVALILSAVALYLTLHGRMSRRQAETPGPAPGPPRDPGLDELAALVDQLGRRLVQLERRTRSEPSQQPVRAPPLAGQSGLPSESYGAGPPAVSSSAEARHSDPANDLFKPDHPQATISAPAPLSTPAPAQRRDDGASWLAGLLEDYARVADDQGGALDSFLARYTPAAVNPEPGANRFTLMGDAESAMLWAVATSAGRYLMMPGPRALANWSGHFAASRSSAAQEYFGLAFDLEPSTPRFSLKAPARLHGGDGSRSVVVVERGRLQGFLD